MATKPKADPRAEEMTRRLMFEILAHKPSDGPIEQSDKVKNIVTDGKSLLMSVICNTQDANREQQLKYILSKEENDINQANYEKNTALHFACGVDDTDTIAFLLNDKRLTILNSKNNNGETPLMIAVSLGKARATATMIKAKGVDLLTTNKDGETLVEVARRRKFKGIKGLLLAKEKAVLDEVAKQIEGRESKPKHQAKRSKHRKKTRYRCTAVQDESLNTEPKEDEKPHKEDFSWLGEHCKSLDKKILGELEPSEEQEIGFDHKEEYKELCNSLELKEKESYNHYKSVDVMEKEKAQEMKDLNSSVEEIKNNEVKREVRKLELEEQIGLLKTELNAIQDKDNEDKKRQKQ